MKISEEKIIDEVIREEREVATVDKGKINSDTIDKDTMKKDEAISEKKIIDEVVSEEREVATADKGKINSDTIDKDTMKKDEAIREEEKIDTIDNDTMKKDEAISEKKKIDTIDKDTMKKNEAIIEKIDTIDNVDIKRKTDAGSLYDQAEQMRMLERMYKAGKNMTQGKSKVVTKTTKQGKEVGDIIDIEAEMAATQEREAKKLEASEAGNIANLLAMFSRATGANKKAEKEDDNQAEYQNQKKKNIPQKKKARNGAPSDAHIFNEKTRKWILKKSSWKGRGDEESIKRVEKLRALQNRSKKKRRAGYEKHKKNMKRLKLGKRLKGGAGVSNDENGTKGIIRLTLESNLSDLRDDPFFLKERDDPSSSPSTRMNLTMRLLTKQVAKAMANEKRLKAQESLRTLMEARSEGLSAGMLPSGALSGGSMQNKKITFDSDDDDDTDDKKKPSFQTSLPSTGSKHIVTDWMGSETDDDEDTAFPFGDKNHFNGSDGEKRHRLQRKINATTNGDSRFMMGTEFADDDCDGPRDDVALPELPSEIKERKEFEKALRERDEIMDDAEGNVFQRAGFGSLVRRYLPNQSVQKSGAERQKKQRDEEKPPLRWMKEKQGEKGNENQVIGKKRMRKEVEGSFAEKKEKKKKKESDSGTVVSTVSNWKGLFPADRKALERRQKDAGVAAMLDADWEVGQEKDGKVIAEHDDEDLSKKSIGFTFSFQAEQDEDDEECEKNQKSSKEDKMPSSFAFSFGKKDDGESSDSDSDSDSSDSASSSDCDTGATKKNPQVSKPCGTFGSKVVQNQEFGTSFWSNGGLSETKASLSKAEEEKRILERRRRNTKDFKRKNKIATRRYGGFRRR
eukprot:g5953.t1